MEAYEKKIQQIDKILKTKNLKPVEREIFIRRKKRLAETIQRHAQKALKQKLQIEADKRIERDLPAIAGESLPHGSEVRIPEQFGGVKTYEQKLPATTIRKFHQNLNYDVDRRMRLRRLVKKHVSKI